MLINKIDFFKTLWKDRSYGIRINCFGRFETYGRYSTHFERNQAYIDIIFGNKLGQI